MGNMETTIRNFFSVNLFMQGLCANHKIAAFLCFNLQVQQHVNLLMEQLCLTEEDVKLRRLVCQLLQEVFHEVYPGASVVPFGSTVSRVGWKGSDLDVCLLTNENAASSQCDDAGVDYSLVIDVLRSFAPGCVNIVPVLTAKCPLIKFKHQPSGLPCDLSVNNRCSPGTTCFYSLILPLYETLFCLVSSEFNTTVCCPVFVRAQFSYRKNFI